jgi:nicotinate phosphoribosyltransferase
LFHIASEKEIRGGRVTDVYFERSREILTQLGIRKQVVMEIAAKKLPRDYEWAVFAGIEEMMNLMEGIRVTVRSMPEGTLFGPNHPVAVIEGDYLEFGLLETSILGLLCQASGVATKAARCRAAAGDRMMVSFGARRIHPAIAPMVERSAYVGGCNGVATLKSAEILDIDPVGTIPHALILLIGDTVEATRAFDKIIDREIHRIALIDTFQDEKFEALRCAEDLGDRLYAVRLDTPASRRGDFREILREVRWELDLRGYGGIRLFVSGGVDEEEIRRLNDLVDGYGIGTSISNAPVIDFSMDIVEIDGKPVSKRGKSSGSKSVYRCEMCRTMEVLPADESRETQPCSCGGTMCNILEKVIGNGKQLRDPVAPSSVRDYVLSQLRPNPCGPDKTSR